MFVVRRDRGSGGIKPLRERHWKVRILNQKNKRKETVMMTLRKFSAKPSTIPTITSYPGPDRSIKLSDLQSGTFISRRYRNRRIGEFLKELNLTEGRGTGIPKILRAMKANGSPAPRFKTDDNRTYFVSYFLVV